MKNILIMMILVFSSCITTKNVKDMSFKLVKATRQTFVVGMPLHKGKDSGIIHLFYFENAKNIIVKNLWIEGVNVDYEMGRTSETAIRLRAVFYSGTKENIHEDIKAPIEYEGRALLEFVEGEETKYIIIDEFERLEMPKDVK